MPQKKTSLQLNKKTWSWPVTQPTSWEFDKSGFWQPHRAQQNNAEQEKTFAQQGNYSVKWHTSTPILSLMTIWTQILDSLPLLTAQAICTEGSARILGLNDLFAMTRDQDKMLMRHSSFLTSYAMSLMGEIE